MNENEFLEKIVPLFKQNSGIAVGPGDDCAVLNIEGRDDEFQLFAVDQVVSDVHYLFNEDEPEEIGRKLVRRNVSDIASMGGEPTSAVITAAVNSDFNRLERIYKGIAHEAERWNMSICGGDYSSIKKPDTEVFTLSILGKVKKENLCLRSNIKPGDYIYATGRFGNSFKSRHHLTFIPRIEQSRFLAGKFTNAMMDVSDGLLLDLKRFSAASSLSLVLNIDKILLRQGAKGVAEALTDGEDYELIFAVNPLKTEELESLWPFDRVELSRIGRAVETSGDSIIINEVDGSDLFSLYHHGGYIH